MIYFLQTNYTNPQTMLYQSILSKLGYYDGKVDGVYGEKTENAVKVFQRNFGLRVDGIIGPLTKRALDKYILGYTFYTIKRGDTIYSIARRYNSTQQLIFSANPDIDAYNLVPGTAILIPFNYEIIPTDVNYTYDILKTNIMGLTKRYPFIQVSSIGKSVLGRELFMLKIGTGKKKIHVNCTHHSLEWINSVFIMQFVERICSAYINNVDVDGFDIANVFKESTLYIVPMVNPDGVELVNAGLKTTNPYYDDLLSWNNTGKPFNEVWQANIRGVDLNHNYDAAWEEYKDVEKSIGITGPAPSRYSGPFPLSEPESKAIADLTIKEDFYLVLAYHTQGEVIYYNFRNLATTRDEEIAIKLAEASGYLLDTAGGVSSYGGYKDWFILEFKKPGYTIETGKGKNPLDLSQLPQIYKDNVGLILTATTV